PQKILQKFHERLEAIVMDPMAGTRDRDRAIVMKSRGLPINLGIGSTRPVSANQQHGAATLVPEVARILKIELVARVQAHVVVEFPPIAPVLITSSAVDCEVLRHLGAEIGIDL